MEPKRDVTAGEHTIREKSALSPKVIRPRAIFFGVLLAVLICAVTPFNNVYRQATPLGGGHFPLAPFFILIWLTIIIAIGGKLFKSRYWLTGKELLIVWMLTVIVSGIAYTGLARTFFLNLTVPTHFANVENRWDEVLQPLMPEALYPQDKNAIDDIYNGLVDGRQLPWTTVLKRIPWQAWLKPLVIWGSFILLCYFVMLCLINLLGRQALYNERMNFPLLRVPQLLEEAFDQNQLGSFLTSRYLLAGIAIPVILHTINGLHFYLPEVPQIPTLILAGPYFPKQGLFSGFYKLKIYIYPAFIGFAFLTSRQISFSFWVFFLLGGLLIGFLSLLGYNIPAAALGVTFGPTLSRPEETQMIGAYLVFFLFLFWLARYHLADILRTAFGFRKTKNLKTEWFSTRLAFWGFVIGSGILLFWCQQMGMSLLEALAVVMAFFLITLVATRVICQGGIAYFTITAAPLDFLILFLGPQFFTAMGLLIAAVAQKVLFVDLRESLMPSLLHARKLTTNIINRRLIFGGISLTLILGVAVSLLAMLALCYKYGIRELPFDWATRTTVSVYESVFTLVESPVTPGHWVGIFAIAGAVVMLILVVCYHRLYWWPIHPLGYLTAYSSAMRILWFSFLIGWACNALCIRYGGVILFKQLRFFFVGLIIGDFLMGGIWAIVGFFGDANYLVLPD